MNILKSDPQWPMRLEHFRACACCKAGVACETLDAMTAAVETHRGCTACKTRSRKVVCLEAQRLARRAAYERPERSGDANAAVFVFPVARSGVRL